MEDLQFPYKWERGRRFNVQSSNKLQRRDDIHENPDVIANIYQWKLKPDHPKYHNPLQQREQRIWLGDEPKNALSINKQKRWQQISTARQNGDIVVEYTGWPNRKKFMRVNGQETSREKFLISVEDDNNQAPTAWKTVSRIKQRKAKQRKQDYDREIAKTPVDGQVIWLVERNHIDPKVIHKETTDSYRNHMKGAPCGAGGGRARRKQLKNDMSNLLKT